MNEYLGQPCCWLWLGKYFALFLGNCSCYSCTESTVSTERSVDRRVALKHVNKGKTNRFFISEIHFYGIINVLQNFKVTVFQFFQHVGIGIGVMSRCSIIKDVKRIKRLCVGQSSQEKKN